MSTHASPHMNAKATSIINVLAQTQLRTITITTTNKFSVTKAEGTAKYTMARSGIKRWDQTGKEDASIFINGQIC